MFFTGKLSWRRLILIGGICAAADVCADMLRAEQYEMKQTYAHPGIRIRSNRCLSEIAENHLAISFCELLPRSEHNVVECLLEVEL